MLESVHEFYPQITGVSLAHQQKVSEGYLWDAYRDGRKVYGVTCIASGYALLIYEGKKIEKIQEGEVALIPPSASYRFMIPLGAKDCLHYTINFQLRDSALPDWIEMDKANIIHTNEFDKLQLLFIESVKLWNKKDYGYKMLVVSNLYRILHSLLLSNEEGQIEKEAYQQVLPAKKYIETNFNHVIELSELAEICHISVTHFRRQFKVALHVSPMVYLQRVRLDKAKDLILIRENKLDTIASMTGFKNASYLTRCFKKNYGMTPTQYQQQY